MMIHLFLLFILFHHVTLSDIMPSCHLMFGSNKYDLTRLSDFTLNGDGKTVDRYHYALNPCGLVPPTSCGIPTTSRTGLMSCQTSVSNTFVSGLAYIDGTKETNASFMEREILGSGVVMTIRNGDGCGTRERIMIVTFMCDDKVTHPASIDVDESPACTFNMEVRAADACPLGSSDGPTSTPFGIGAIFVIVVVVIVTIYLVGGLSWKRFKQDRHGLDTIPHRDFWANTIALIIYGCRFSFSKVCRMSNSKY